jgi:hypothetical protein
MASKDEHMLEAVQQYPCPWCSEQSGFGRGVYSGYQRLSAEVRALAQFLNPVKAFTNMFGPTGMMAFCLKCHQPIAICGYCDHPNRDIGVFMVCNNCGKKYSY